MIDGVELCAAVVFLLANGTLITLFAAVLDGDNIPCLGYMPKDITIHVASQYSLRVQFINSKSTIDNQIVSTD